MARPPFIHCEETRRYFSLELKCRQEHGVDQLNTREMCEAWRVPRVCDQLMSTPRVNMEVSDLRFGKRPFLSSRRVSIFAAPDVPASPTGSCTINRNTVQH